MNMFTMLKGLTAVAPKNDVRYYLNGIYITPTRFIATDGHMMVVVEQETADVVEPVIVCRTDLSNKLKMFNKKSELTLNFVDGEPYLNEMKLNTVDGRYPDVSRVINRYESETKTAEPIGFDLVLMAQMCKAIDTIADNKIKGATFTFYNANAACKVEKNAVTGYLMPCRL